MALGIVAVTNLIKNYISTLNYLFYELEKIKKRGFSARRICNVS